MCTNLCRASHLIVEVGSCAIQKQNGSRYLAKLLPRSLSSIRIFEFLSSAKHVLVAGIGGSYDFMSGLPIVFHLIGRRKERLYTSPASPSLAALSGRTAGRSLPAAFKSIQTRSPHLSTFRRSTTRSGMSDNSVRGCRVAIDSVQAHRGDPHDRCHCGGGRRD